MEFERNELFDKLIIKVKENREILKEMDFEELSLFVDYLERLNTYLESKGDE